MEAYFQKLREIQWESRETTGFTPTLLQSQGKHYEMDSIVDDLRNKVGQVTREKQSEEGGAGDTTMELDLD